MYAVFNEEMLAKKVSGYRKIALILTIIVTLIMAYFGVEAYLNAKDILADYSTVQATVVGAEHRQEQGRKGRIKDVYEVSYQFNHDNKDYNDSFTTNADKFEDYKRSGLVRIAYSNKNPQKFDRLDLLQVQADVKDLGKRMGMVFVLVYLFFSFFVWIAKARWKKRLGQPMEVED